jgi:hypothetical protein
MFAMRSPFVLVLVPGLMKFECSPLNFATNLIDVRCLAVSRHFRHFQLQSQSFVQRIVQTLLLRLKINASLYKKYLQLAYVSYFCQAIYATAYFD